MILRHIRSSAIALASRNHSATRSRRRRASGDTGVTGRRLTSQVQGAAVKGTGCIDEVVTQVRATWLDLAELPSRICEDRPDLRTVVRVEHHRDRARWSVHSASKDPLNRTLAHVQQIELTGVTAFGRESCELSDRRRLASDAVEIRFGDSNLIELHRQSQFGA